MEERADANLMEPINVPLGMRQLVARAMRLSGGTAVGYAITLMATPIIAKWYGPEAFGVWAGWLALAGIIGAIACLRYETAIALPENDREALHVAAVAILLTVLICVVSGILLVGALILEITGPWQRLGIHAVWIPLGALIIAWMGVATQWLARVHQVTALAKAKIWSSGVTAGVQLAMGWSGGTGGLILGDIVGRSAGLWGRIMEVWRQQASNIAAIQWRDLCETLRRYRSHSGWMTPTALVDAIGQQAPLLLMLSWYGGTIGGQFTLTQRLLALPVALLGQSVAQLFLPAMANAHRYCPYTALRLFLGLSGLLALVGAVLVGAAWHLDASWLVSLLGTEWAGIGHFLLPLSLLVSVQLLVSTVSQTAIVLGGQKWYAIWVLSWVTAGVGGMWAGHRLNEVEGAVWGLMFGSGGLYVILWLVLFATLRNLAGKDSYIKTI